MELREIVKNIPPLELPNTEDFFVLKTDASEHQWGVVYMTIHPKDKERKRKICCYKSGTFTPAQINYHAHEKELLAVVLGIEKYALFLRPKKFLIETDSKFVQYFRNAQLSKFSQRRLINWHHFLNEFDYDVKHVSGKTNELADIVSREKIFASNPDYPDIAECFTTQMIGDISKRGRGRMSRGRGRDGQRFSYSQMSQDSDYAQYLQFCEYKKMQGLVITAEEHSEGESSEGNPPSKTLKCEESTEETWQQVNSRVPASPREKTGPPRILEDIDQALYPPGFCREEYSKKNMVGNVFLRNCYAQNQFQIGALRKEFTKPELLIADNLWNAFSHALRIEAKQSIIAALRTMREMRFLTAQEKIQADQYKKELVSSTGNILYSDIVGEAQIYTYKKHSFQVTLSAQTKDRKPDFEKASLMTREATLMSQICQGVIEPRITLVPGSTDAIPWLWLTDEAISEFQEGRKETLLSTGFVRYKILPLEATKVLKKTIREYPYSLITYVLAPGEF